MVERRPYKTDVEGSIPSMPKDKDCSIIKIKENFLISIIYESKSSFIFEKCEFYQKLLNEMEKKFCDEKTVETGIFHQICSNCLNEKCNGLYPALT